MDSSSCVTRSIERGLGREQSENTGQPLAALVRMADLLERLAGLEAAGYQVRLNTKFARRVESEAECQEAIDRARRTAQDAIADDVRPG